MNYTDDQLKKTLAKMLPDVISYREVIAYESFKIVCLLQWGAKWNHKRKFMVRDTELLHLCWLVEETLTAPEVTSYSDALEYAETRWWSPFNASWQQRVESLAKVKGIQI
jgi:hypothetical protein